MSGLTQRQLDKLNARVRELEAENARLQTQLDSICVPGVKDFLNDVKKEAEYQRLRWPREHDAGKTDADWFWLIGFLAQKVLYAPTEERRLHHTISTAAACLNWHAHITGVHTRMRPGIDLSENEGKTHD